MTTFKCCGCKRYLERSEFGGVKKRADYCRPCGRVMSKKYRDAHPDLCRERNNRAASKRYETNRESLIAYLNEHPCVDCGETDIVVLEFDHVDPSTKRQKIANVLGSWKWDTILTEIAKCEVRCANCHRRRTAKQFGWYKGGGAG